MSDNRAVEFDILSTDSSYNFLRNIGYILEYWIINSSFYHPDFFDDYVKTCTVADFQISGLSNRESH